MESANSVARTIEYVNSKKSGKRVYIQGLIAVAIFLISLLIVILLYVPLISQTNDLSKRRVTLEAEVAALQKKFDTISKYDVAEMAKDLESASFFIPDDIRVAQLATFINVNALKYNLEVARLGINEDRSEVKQTVDENEKGKLLGDTSLGTTVFLGRVEGPFSFRGTRDDIYKFLDFLVMGGFATNFDQVSITSGDQERNWSVTFFTSYYYLKPLQQVPARIELLEVNKDALRPITVNQTEIAPTPVVSPSGTPSITVTP